MTSNTYWTVDQALIWLATADLDLVGLADPLGDHPESWTTMRIRDDTHAHFTTENIKLTETTLLALLRDGKATAFCDQQPIDPLWFHGAFFHHGGGDLARKVRHVDEFATLICRVEDAPRYQSREYEERDIVSMPMLIVAEPLIGVRRRARAYNNPSVPTPSEIDLVALQRKRFVFLGQAVRWIIGIQRPETTANEAQLWDAAEADLFEWLDDERVPVEGYVAGGVYEELPQGIWARMNRGGDGDPWFTPLDDKERREDGASIAVGSHRWYGVRIRTEAVTQRWPKSELPEASEEAEGPCLDRDAAIKQMIEYLEQRDKQYLADKASRLTWREWVGSKIRSGVAGEQFPGTKPSWAVAAWKNAELSKSFRGEKGRQRQF